MRADRRDQNPGGEKEREIMIYLELFWSFLQIGLFSFGGGYAAMPLIQSQVVTDHSWLNMTEFTDLITISQMTPGPIAINSATFVGIKIAGIGGCPGGDPWVYPAVLHHRDIDSETISEVPEYGHSSGCPEFASSGCRSDDCIRRNLHSHYGILGK